MTLLFREVGTVQQRLLELDGIVEELEHDKARVRRAYDQLMEQATKTVDAMDAEIQVPLREGLLGMRFCATLQ